MEEARQNIMQRQAVFKAIFDTQEILEWYAPQTFTHVFKVFKMWGQYGECTGVLFCNNRPIRATGKNKEEFLKDCIQAIQNISERRI